MKWVFALESSYKYTCMYMLVDMNFCAQTYKSINIYGFIIPLKKSPVSPLCRTAVFSAGSQS